MNFPVSAQGLLYKLDPSITNYIQNLTATGRSRSLDVTIAVAMVASTLLSIPSSPVEDPEAYYQSQAGSLSINFVNAVNGIVPVDFRYILDLTRKFFAQRYEAATMPFQAMTNIGKYGIDNIFGLTKHIPENVLAHMCECDKDIIRHFHMFNQIKCALSAE